MARYLGQSQHRFRIAFHLPPPRSLRISSHSHPRTQHRPLLDRFYGVQIVLVLVQQTFVQTRPFARGSGRELRACSGLERA